ncbi:MAG: signal peptidase I [Candidatus Marinimicrobia bacterium]|nr:signal peptidase I [Candidatus Neomarinimicrobiota bacterium]
MGKFIVFLIEGAILVYWIYSSFIKKRDKSKDKTIPSFRDSKKERMIYEIKSWAWIFIAVFFIRSGLVCAYLIPTGSMKNTIKIGDFVLGNQVAYGIRTPDWFGIPFTRKGFFIPHITIPTFGNPKSGDIVIFEYPHDPWTNYVKRCVGASGDSLEIIDKKLFINGERFEDPEKSIIPYDNILSKKYQERRIFPYGNGNKDQYKAIYIPKKGDTLNAETTQLQIIAYVAYMDKEHAFSRDLQSGPYGYLKDIKEKAGKYYLDDVLLSEYVVKQNYYFMMGDNRDNSADSRFWGFVPQKYILGKPLVRWMSWNKEGKFLSKIRWNRIFIPMR